MADRYTAIVLLERRWEFDPVELADVLSERFPELGSLSGRGDPKDPTRVSLAIDGAEIRIAHRRGSPAGLPASDGADAFGYRPQRSSEPGPLLSGHVTHLEVTCGDYGAGLEWMKAYATVITLVAGALARLGPARGVLFPSAGTVLTPQEAYQAGRTALRGVSPIEAWVALYPYTPENRTEEPVAGAFTRGLTAFIGREIELAPSPIDGRTALSRLHGAAWQALDGETAFEDGSWMGDPFSAGRAKVRRSDGWLRPDVPAIVLVGTDSVVEPMSLELLPPAKGSYSVPIDVPVLPRIDALFEGMDFSFKGTIGWVRARVMPVLGPFLRSLPGLLASLPRHVSTAAKALRPATDQARRIMGDLYQMLSAQLARTGRPKRVGD
ncbi:MAG: hypothetical protein AAF183_02010 [Pseudomonadota bacterium]